MWIVNQHRQYPHLFLGEAQALGTPTPWYQTCFFSKLFFEDYSSLWSRWTRQFLLALRGVIICHFFWSALALQRLEICLVLPVKQKQDDHLPCVTQWSGSISKVFGFVSVLTEKSYDVLNMDFLRSYQKLNGEYPIYYSMLSIFKKTCCTYNVFHVPRTWYSWNFWFQR